MAKIVNMTEKRITAALTEAGISLDGLTITTNEVEVYCKNKKGEFSRSKTEATRRKVVKALGFGGFRCAHGGWVLQRDLQDMGDWNDRSSKWHY